MKIERSVADDEQPHSAGAVRRGLSGSSVRVDGDCDHQSMPFLAVTVGGTAVGNLTSGSITPLLSHAAVGDGRVRTLLIANPKVARGLASQPGPTPWTP